MPNSEIDKIAATYGSVGRVGYTGDESGAFDGLKAKDLFVRPAMKVVGRVGLAGLAPMSAVVAPAPREVESSWVRFDAKTNTITANAFEAQGQQVTPDDILKMAGIGGAEVAPELMNAYLQAATKLSNELYKQGINPGELKYQVAGSEDPNIFPQILATKDTKKNGIDVLFIPGFKGKNPWIEVKETDTFTIRANGDGIVRITDYSESNNPGVIFVKRQKLDLGNIKPMWNDLAENQMETQRDVLEVAVGKDLEYSQSGRLAIASEAGLGKFDIANSTIESNLKPILDFTGLEKEYGVIKDIRIVLVKQDTVDRYVLPGEITYAMAPMMYGSYGTLDGKVAIDNGNVYVIFEFNPDMPFLKTRPDRFISRMLLGMRLKNLGAWTDDPGNELLANSGPITFSK